jgi:hypothetical protein
VNRVQDGCRPQQKPLKGYFRSWPDRAALMVAYAGVSTAAPDPLQVWDGVRIVTDRTRHPRFKGCADKDVAQVPGVPLVRAVPHPSKRGRDLISPAGGLQTPAEGMGQGRDHH